MASIGFIGLGNMGLPMALNLVKAGHDVMGHDLSDKQLATLSEAGGRRANGLDDIATCEVIVSMLPAGKHVAQIYGGEEGLIKKVKAGTLLIDSSTIDVATARAIADEAAGAGLDMVDAPVSGGVGGAQAGTLTFMVGGPEAAFEKAKPFLEVMGAKIVHAGDAGTGQAAKICNNMLLAISMIGVSEAFSLARKLGLSDQKFFDIASTSSGQCWSMTSYCPVPGPVPASPANRDYAPGFATDMMLKDLRLAKDAAQSVQAKTDLGDQSLALYAALSEDGYGGLDFSGVFKRINGDI
ncbi:3-hydroxyisobutyrate dehydrogenase [Iodidimonas muriae]|uniref:3-hydroxyisobutyrate dehydrogenase n=1 Tax=Iodidimonas muriae TaxID=261467 RepID=A0ABQ2LFW7_9PROT|nr:3-hydroxyisobutyrate dehydrogenase [Iodidimonas muriae]GER08317.1 3-hydroxyisobutyrate dehydrogenase [Kordiimonadales bacterium JCM 17843]GGO16309.1 3-hydroxyisobutyrate dehydrogenase [Iodidimonas muriae]